MPGKKTFIMVMMVVLSMFMAVSSPSYAQTNPDNSNNPLLSPFKTPFEAPPFELIKSAHFVPAIKEGIKLHQAEIDAIANNSQPATFENTIEALDASGKLLGQIEKILSKLRDSNNNPELEAVANEVSPILTAHGDYIGLNEKLFARVKTVYEKKNTLKLTPSQAYLLENVYQGFVRSGALLNETQKARMRELNKEISLLSLKFESNLLAETNDSYIVIDKKEDLTGLNENIIAMGAETAKEMGMTDKWVYTTQRPSWTPFLQSSSNRKLREALYTAYFMRGDRDNDKDNKALLQKLVCLRSERSKLLGYKTTAEFYLADRMAKTPENVNAFLLRLWKPAVERAKSEVADMQAIVDRENGGFKIAPWDWWYYSEKVRKEKYDLDDSALRPYFQLENVKKGIFTLAEKLFGLKFIERKDMPIYHPDVQVYEVKEANGSHLGILYMDFFPRASKGGGAWSGTYRNAYYKNGIKETPIVDMVCNFTKPTPGTPSLLSLDEVTTLFHEFGHALNSLCFNGVSRTDYSPQDSVELPSQIMENWALEPELLKTYATHYKTGEVIPASMVEKIRKSMLFNQGFETVEYLAASILDMTLHNLESAANMNMTKFENNTMTTFGLNPEILPRYRLPYFGHIISGYTAGYYSYIWAGVLDSDAFEAFKETTLFDKKTAASFRQNILAKLGTEDAMTLYKKFRGREPKVEPLLKRRGLLKEQAN